ncbi:hypothetical protein [Pseudorhodoplanes sp.]|uniref:hypothetical protein n=1 Tax=Pseudorhodoplanes sp. TaxID=1934341 RepID=UPI003D0C27D5
MSKPASRDYALVATHSPYLDRAGLRTEAKIVGQMADDFLVFATNRGCVTEADLELAGWTASQIAAHGAAAARRARTLAADRG